MTDVPVKPRSLYCGTCKDGAYISRPVRMGNNSRPKFRKWGKGKNRSRRRAIYFIYKDNKLIPVCKSCRQRYLGKYKLIPLQDRWDEYVVQAMMAI